MSAVVEKPDPSLFVKNERPREYDVRFRVEGEVYETIMADSPEEARAKAEAMMEADDSGLELHDFSEIEVASVRKSPTMYLVLQNGVKMQVSRLEAGDLPRQPDERGF